MHTLIISSTFRWDVCQLAHLFYANIEIYDRMKENIFDWLFYIATQKPMEWASEWVSEHIEYYTYTTRSNRIGKWQWYQRFIYIITLKWQEVAKNFFSL